MVHLRSLFLLPETEAFYHLPSGCQTLRFLSACGGTKRPPARSQPGGLFPRVVSSNRASPGPGIFAHTLAVTGMQMNTRGAPPDLPHSCFSVHLSPLARPHGPPSPHPSPPLRGPASLLPGPLLATAWEPLKSVSWRNRGAHLIHLHLSRVAVLHWPESIVLKWCSYVWIWGAGGGNHGCFEQILHGATSWS